MTVDLSVAVPARDDGSHLRRMLESLLSQDCGGCSWEAVIADDGSEPPVSSSCAGLLRDSPGVRVVRLEPARGRAAARNAALRECRGDIVLMMDGDMELPGDLLRGHLERHRAGGCEVVMGRCLNAWRESPGRFQVWSDSRGMGDRPAGPFPWRYFATGNVSVVRRLLEEAGGFDERMTGYGGEDTELGYRLHRMGARLCWDPSLTVRHLGAETDVVTYARRMVSYGANGLPYMLRKHPGIGFLLGSRWVEPVLARPRRPACVFMRLLSRALVNAPLYRLVLWWLRLTGFPRFLYTYISVGGCMLGLRGRNFE